MLLAQAAKARSSSFFNVGGKSRWTAAIAQNAAYPISSTASPHVTEARRGQELKVYFGMIRNASGITMEPRMETAYNLVHRLRCLFKSKITPEEAKPKLDEWCKDIGKSLIMELISVRDTLRQKETEILNYFTNRSTNASAESLNSKIKGFRAELRGIQDLPFFMYRLVVLFG